MFRLNQEATTITGELVTPYMVENSSIYCWNRQGKTVVKNIKDFSLSGPITTERMSGGVSVLAITPIRGTTIVKTPVVEVEVSRPTVEADIITQDEVASGVTSDTNRDVNIAPAVTVNPDVLVDEKITYVHVAPAVDDNLYDGELQTGGVEVVDADEAEGRTEFVPAIEDDDYI